LSKRRPGGEVTRLNSGGQFKPFIYLNFGTSRTRASLGRSDVAKEKSPAFRRGLPDAQVPGLDLATALALLVGILALTVRVLLLLTRLLAAALLLAGLLTGLLVLLARILVLLARFLVLVGHRDLPG
jgi:hypothetical protein